MATMNRPRFVAIVVAVSSSVLVDGCQQRVPAVDSTSADAGTSPAVPRLADVPLSTGSVTRPNVDATPGAAPPTCAPARGLMVEPVPAIELVEGVSRTNLSAWVYALAGDGLRGREAWTDNSRRAARLVADGFFRVGVTAPFDDGYCQPFTRGERSDQNVIGHVAPREDGRPCGWVVVGAHYDGLGVDEQGRIRPGADDNATGVAVLLEAGRRLAERPAKVGVVLAAFGAEEQGLVGSKSYVAGPTVALDRVALMINVDMAGRRPGGNAELGYQATGPNRASTSRRVRRAGKSAGVGVIAMMLGDRGDSSSFSPHVPTVFFSTTVHADYHQPTDTPDRVDYAQVERMARVVLAIIDDAACA